MIVATGAYQRPTPSSLRDAAPQAIFQQHTAEYRNPASLPDGAVLVVGSGQSGCQVAEDLLGAGRDVYLSVGACPWVPRSHRGRDLVYWMAETGLLDQTVDTLTAPNALVACNPAVSGTEGGHDCNPLTLMAAAPCRSAGSRASAAPARCSRTTSPPTWPRASRSRRGSVGSSTSTRGRRRSPPPRASATSGSARARSRRSRARSSGHGLPARLRVDRVAGARCLRPPAPRRGVTDFPGLAFLGVHWLHKRKSSLFIGVGEDAEHVVSQVAV